MTHSGDKLSKLSEKEVFLASKGEDSDLNFSFCIAVKILMWLND